MAIPQRDVLAYLDGLPGLDITRVPDAHFYFYDPARDTPHDRRQPFATVVARDDYDGASDLAARGLYRLNMGVSRETYRGLFGPEPAWGKDGRPVETGHDLAAVDTFLPHPVYAPMGWICIVSPSAESWARAQEYVREAHALARRQFERRAGGHPA